MKKIKLSLITPDECQGVQINGTDHCKKISCKWQGLSACIGMEILKTGHNSLGYRITNDGISENQ